MTELSNAITSGLFHLVEDADAVIRQKGSYYQVKVYHRNNDLYVKHGSAYLKLFSYGTSRPDTFLDGFVAPFEPKPGKHSVLQIPN